MPTPTKPTNVIRIEKKSHRTKSELRSREQAEAQLLTGKELKESEDVKKNKLAHKEFARLKKLLFSVQKDDDLYGNIINRYCLLTAECTEFQEKRERIYQEMVELGDKHDNFEANEDLATYYKLQNSMQKNLVSMDRQLQGKRKMLLDIEKENIMTIASSLRTIPKKPEKKGSALKEALAGD